MSGIMVTREGLEQAYKAVNEATEAAFTAGCEFDLAKAELEKKILLAKASGRITGKNDGERDAAALALFPEEHGHRDAKEDIYKLRKNALELAKINLDFLRDCLRVEELVRK